MNLKSALQLLNLLNNKLGHLESNFQKLEEKVNKALLIQRYHILRIKNGDLLKDKTILNGLPYNEMSPTEAFNIYQDNNSDFLILDVTISFPPGTKKIEGSLCLPYNNLKLRVSEIPSKQQPLWVISENGTHSILACEYLSEIGYYNLTNISGGHKFWPGHNHSSELDLVEGKEFLK